MSSYEGVTVLGPDEEDLTHTSLHLSLGTPFVPLYSTSSLTSNQAFSSDVTPPRPHPPPIDTTWSFMNNSGSSGAAGQDAPYEDINTGILSQWATNLPQAWRLASSPFPEGLENNHSPLTPMTSSSSPHTPYGYLDNPFNASSNRPASYPPPSLYPSPRTSSGQPTPSPQQPLQPLTPTLTAHPGYSPRVVNGSPSALYASGLPDQSVVYFGPSSSAQTTPTPPYTVPGSTSSAQTTPTPPFIVPGNTYYIPRGIFSAPADMPAPVNSTPIELGPFIPQKTYSPHTSSDRRRYVDEVELDPPIIFRYFNPYQEGIPLQDALSNRFVHLVGRDDPMFIGRGPSISVRLVWEGYGPWSRQIPTRDFRSPPGPVTRAKLAKNVAKSVKRFIDEHASKRMDANGDPRFRVGPTGIKVEDLLLVELHHVSMGSWQANLRLRHPLP